MSKQTKAVAKEVDNDLLNGAEIHEAVNDLLNEEKDNLPDLTVDEWNEIYLDMTQEMHDMIARDLLEDRKQDIGASYEINQAFSELAIE